MDIGKTQHSALTRCSNRFKLLSLRTLHEPAHGGSAGAGQTGHSRAAAASLKYHVLSTLCFLHSKALNPQAPPLTTARRLVENRSAMLRTAESPSPQASSHAHRRGARPAGKRVTVGPSPRPPLSPIPGEKPIQSLLFQTVVCSTGIDAPTHSLPMLSLQDKTLALPEEAG